MNCKGISWTILLSFKRKSPGQQVVQLYISPDEEQEEEESKSCHLHQASIEVEVIYWAGKQPQNDEGSCTGLEILKYQRNHKALASILKKTTTTKKSRKKEESYSLLNYDLEGVRELIHFHGVCRTTAPTVEILRKKSPLSC